MVRILTFVSVVFCYCGLAGAAGGEPLRVYLPRTATVDAKELHLGVISIIRGRNAELCQKAGKVSIGRAPWSGEKIVVDRRTILSRLAACGIAPGLVRLTGAAEVVVSRNERVVTADEILSVAKAFLEKARPGPPGCLWKLSRRPQDAAVEDGKDVQLTCKLADDSPRGYVKVNVSADAGNRRQAVGDVLFKVVYPARRAVVTKDIPAGGIVTGDNARIEVVTSNRPDDGNWASPLGMVVSRHLKAGTIIRPPLVRPRRPAVVVKRNQTVVMKIEGLGFSISGLAIAMQDGRPAEFIKVRNIDSKRILIARVQPDGSVRPVFNEVKE